MRITIDENADIEEDEVIIKCRVLNDDIFKIIHNIKSGVENFIGYEGGHIHRINPDQVYYIEAVDNKVFIYGKETVYESKQKLYELELFTIGMPFIRVSKSVILNLTKITYVSPAYGGRFEASLDNGENQIISRQYVPELKKKLHI